MRLNSWLHRIRTLPEACFRILPPPMQAEALSLEGGLLGFAIFPLKRPANLACAAPLQVVEALPTC